MMVLHGVSLYYGHHNIQFQTKHFPFFFQSFTAENPNILAEYNSRVISEYFSLILTALSFAVAGFALGYIETYFGPH